MPQEELQRESRTGENPPYGLVCGVKRTRHHRECFTLIELLVVVAIIAVLVAILLPAMQHAREKARAAVCMSNLKQIAVAILMYADDYDDWFPPGHNSSAIPEPREHTGTQLKLRPYLGLCTTASGPSAWICPTDKQPPNFGETADQHAPYSNPKWGQYAHYTSYGENKAVHNDGGGYAWYNGYGMTNYYSHSATRRFSEVENASETVMYASCSGTDYACYSGQSFSDLPNIHSGGDNFLFCDGHVKWVEGMNRADPRLKAIK